MTTPDAITVVVPLWNGARYIGEVVSCLATQTRADFHVLYIDDGSSDDTTKIVETTKRPADRLIRKTNSGLYDTLNFATDHVETEWIALLFQDDRVAPRWIERTAELLDDGIDCLWFAIDNIDAAGNVLRHGLDTSRIERIPPSLDAWRSALRRGTFWTISGSVLKASTLRRMRFRPDLPHCSDFEFLLRGLRTLTFTYVEEPLVAIREHAGAASTRNLASGRDLDERIAIFAEQFRSAPGHAPLAFRTELASRVGQQILQRAVGAAKRGHLSRALAMLSRLPRAAALMARS